MLVASGCSSDDQREPAAPAPAEEPAAEPAEPAEEPAAEPAEEPEEPAEPAEPAEEPAAEPAEEPAEPAEEPAAPLEALAITGETAVGDLLDRLPGGDRDCVRDRFGDSEYETLAATTLAQMFLDVAAAERLLECFEVEDSRGLALVEAQEGGLTSDTRGCLVALSFDHPELFALRIGVPIDALDVDHVEVHQMFLNIYDCMAPLEQLVLATRIQSGFEMADPATLGDFAFGFTEDEASCLAGAFDDWEALLETPLSDPFFSGPEIGAAAAACIGPNLADFRVRTFVALALASMSGSGSQESFDCMVNLVSERLSWSFLAAYDEVPMEEFTETRDPAVFEADLDLYAGVVRDSVLLFDCLSDDELRRFQERIPVALQAFQSHQGSLAVTGETAVGDLLDRLPGEDRDCVRGRFGDSEYETLAATTLAGLFVDVAAAERLLECFEAENSRGLALIEAQEGGLAPGTRGCLVALSFEHPELFALRIGVPLDALDVDHLEIHQMFLDIMGCMAPLEQLVSMTRIRVGLEMSDPLTLRDLEPAFTEDQASCMSRAIDDWEAVLDGPPVTATPRPDVTAATVECIGPELADLQARFFAASFLALASDGGSQESLDCLADFSVENPDQAAAFGAVPMQEFTETRDLAVFEADLDLYSPAVQSGISMLECLSDDELRRFQERIPPALQAFQSHQGSLAVTAETAVGDLLDRLPGGDRDCVRGRFGDSDYETLAATTLAGLFADIAAAERLLECFEAENSRGLALVEAQEGGLTPGTRGCLVALSFEHPELFALRIGVPLDALDVDHLEIHQMFLGIYGCMTPIEQLVLTARIRVGLEMTNPLKLRDLAFALTEDEASCLSEAFDDWETVLDTPLSEVLSRPETSVVAAVCVGPNRADFELRRFGASALAWMSGGKNQESLSCIVNTVTERLSPNFMTNYMSLPLEEFAEARDLAVFEANLDLYSGIVQEALLLLDCLSDDELRRFQQRVPAALQAFQSHPGSSA